MVEVVWLTLFSVSFVFVFPQVSLVGKMWRDGR